MRDAIFATEDDKTYIEISTEEYWTKDRIAIVGKPFTITHRDDKYSTSSNATLYKAFLSIKNPQYGRILVYLLENKIASNNCIEVTLDDLSEYTGVCRRTVAEAMKYFQEQGFIKRFGKSLLMISPNLQVSGTSDQMASLYHMFTEFEKYGLKQPKINEEATSQIV